MTKTSVALLGLGTMGSGMAGNLLKAGFELTIYNRTAAKTEPFVALGARVAKSPSAAAQGADIIIAMLSDDAASREAWVGQNGALASANTGCVLVEASTLSPTWIAEPSEMAIKRDCARLERSCDGKPYAG